VYWLTVLHFGPRIVGYDVDRLNQRQRLFCDSLLSGMSQAAAYRSAGYSPNRAETEAAKLVRTPVVSRYLELKRSEAERIGAMTRDRGLALLGGIAEDSSQAGAVRVRAVESLARLMGWNAPDRMEVSGPLAGLLARLRQ
jgi:hypothetical protein